MTDQDHFLPYSQQGTCLFSLTTSWSAGDCLLPPRQDSSSQRGMLLLEAHTSQCCRGSLQQRALSGQRSHSRLQTQPLAGSSRRREHRAAADRRAWLAGSEAVFLSHPVTPERGQAACGLARPGSPAHSLHTARAGAALHPQTLVLGFMLTSASLPFCSKCEAVLILPLLWLKHPWWCFNPTKGTVLKGIWDLCL